MSLKGHNGCMQGSHPFWHANNASLCVVQLNHVKHMRRSQDRALQISQLGASTHPRLGLGAPRHAGVPRGEGQLKQAMQRSDQGAEVLRMLTPSFLELCDDHFEEGPGRIAALLTILRARLPSIL